VSSALVRAASAFFAGSRTVSAQLGATFGFESDKPFWARFESTAAAALRALPPGSTVLDLGGGRRCVYAGALPEDHQLRLVAVDISEEELAANRDVSDTCVADIAQGLPFEEASVDFILSRALLEHVDGVPRAAANMARVLRPGGRALHFVPGRYSLFGIAARVLPFGPLLRLHHMVVPSSRNEVEFEVVYDHCHPAALERVFREAGFAEVEVEVCWAQPGYFESLPPLYLLTSLYERAAQALGLRRAAAYMIVSATR
jgi:SAM-dependent methyltransferase